MFLRSLFILATLVPAFSTWAQNFNSKENVEFVSSVVCKPFSDIKDSVYFSSSKDKAFFMNSKYELQKFIINSADIITKALADGNYALAAIGCAELDDYTLSFSETCVDDEGKNILPPKSFELCQCELALNPAETCRELQK